MADGYVSFEAQPTAMTHLEARSVDHEKRGLSLRAVIVDTGCVVLDIDEVGGVAINMFGEVAFHGDVVKPNSGSDTVRAVLTQHRVIAKEGDTLPDGTVLDEISEIGGVAINFFGDVAFHGRTGGVEAVFTQHGLVGKVGDPLTDATNLGEIHQNGGVAINFFGEVAFHGKVGADTNVVIVGEAPIPDESSTE